MYGIVTMDNPRISIIVPTYNSEKTINHCINSLLCQEFKDFEILVIDGASTDNTLENLSKFDDFRIRVYSERDKGIYDAMNKGLLYSKGKWLYFLGSDDTMYANDILGKIFNIINTQDMDVIYGNVLNEYTNTVYDGEFNAKKLSMQNICHQAIFFKKDIFKITGLFDLKYLVCADWDHNIKWFLNSNIKNKYYDLIISKFASGGTSSISRDIKFSIDLRWKLIICNKDNMQFSEKCFSLFNEIIYCVKNSKEKSLINLLINSPNLFF